MLSQRDAFFKEVFRKALRDPQICIVTADMSAPGLDHFRTRFPARYINTGIAEQAAILVACGLAHEGMKPYVFAIEPFISLRPYEQIKVVAALMNYTITIVGVGAGMSYCDSGPTHHAVDDFAIMRILPNVEVWNVSDPHMAKEAALRTSHTPGVSYVRLDRTTTENIEEERLRRELGGFRVLAKHPDRYIITTGYPVHLCQSLKKKHELGAGLIEIYRFPPDWQRIREYVRGKRVLCIEENNPYGGLFAALCEGGIVPDDRMALAHSYPYRYGSREQLLGHHGITTETIKRWTYSF